MDLLEAQHRFQELTAANVRYWLARTQELPRLDLAELDGDRQNLYRAVQIGLAQPDTWRETAELLLQSWRFIEGRGYWNDWIPFLQEAVARCQHGKEPLRCRLLNRLGHAQRLAHQWQHALSAHRQARALAQELDQPLLAARSDYYLSSTYYHMKEFAQAEEHGQRAVDALRRLAPGSAYLAMALNELGQIAHWQGEYEQAEAYYEESIGYWRQLDDAGDLASVLLNLALTRQSQERIPQALALYEEAMSLLTSIGSELRKALIQCNLGSLYFSTGAYQRAEEIFRQVDLAYLRRIGHIRFQATVALGLGNSLLKQGRVEAAASYLQQSHQLWLAYDDDIFLANSLGALADVAVARGEVQEAIPLFEEAIRLLEDYPDHAWARQIHAEFQKELAALTGSQQD